jgi:hypothetical protein
VTEPPSHRVGGLCLILAQMPLCRRARYNWWVGLFFSAEITGREITVPEGFDPYYKWLGIPPKDQPPHHYRLLAIPLYEADPEVIESAADQRMGHVRTFQAGRYGALSQQILNELAAARVCLLSHEKKLAYDAELQATLAPAPPLPPPQIPVSTVLRSPPPPVGRAPTVASLPGQGEIAAPPAGSVLSQPAPVFPPLDSTLPDPTPPVVTASRKAASGSRRLSLVVSVLGIALLASAAIAFWMLYSDQQSHELAAPSGRPSASAPQPIPEPITTLPADEEVPTERKLGVPADTMDLVTQAGQASSDDPAAPDPPTPEPAEPVEPSGGVSMADLPEEATETATSMTPSLADMLELPDDNSEAVANGMEGSPSTGAEAGEDSTAEKEPEKWRVPKPAALSRARNRMQPVQGDYSILLVEAQKSDRPSTEVYILLTGAHDKAVATMNASGALQAIDLIEEKFLGDFDDQRVESLGFIGVRMAQQRNPRQFRDLADVALQASQEAQQEENARLARSLGNIALEAAKKARDTTRQERITAHLEQL